MNQTMQWSADAKKASYQEWLEEQPILRQASVDKKMKGEPRLNTHEHTHIHTRTSESNHANWPIYFVAKTEHGSVQ